MRLLSLFLAVLALGASCRVKDDSRPSPRPRPAATLDASAPARGARRLWLKLAGGAITDLDSSADGGAIFVATSPDPDIPGSLKEGFLTRYDASGKVIWRKKQRGQVKAQSVSRDGSWVVVSNYLDDLIAYGPTGQVRWQAEAVCRPVFLSAASKVLCFHDDDAEPQVAFDVFDFKGSKELSVPTRRDVLGLKVAKDESAFAISQVEGHLQLYSAKDFKLAWERRVEGEVLDLDVLGGPDPRVAVLFSRLNAGRRLALLTSQGPGPEVAIEAAVRQVEWASDGAAIALYGNSQEGQTLVYYGLNAGDAVPKLEWERRDSRPADYSSSALAGKQVLWMGFENNRPETRTSSLLGYDAQGKLLWNLNLQAEDGAYLYAKAFSETSNLMAVGTDDGRLGLFRLLRRH